MQKIPTYRQFEDAVHRFVNDIPLNDVQEVELRMLLQAQAALAILPFVNAMPPPLTKVGDIKTDNPIEWVPLHG